MTIDEGGKKRCVTCKETLPLSDFNKNKSRKDGLHSQCKSCLKQYRNRPDAREKKQVWHSENAERVRESRKNYYEANKDRLLEQNKQYRLDNLDAEKARSVAYYAENREEILARQKAKRLADPEKTRDTRLRTLYKMGVEDYNEMLEKQGHKCCICNGVNENGAYLSVDHDHSCCPGVKSCGKCVRGLLCHACNVSVGFMQDSPERFIRAAIYLMSFKS